MPTTVDSTSSDLFFNYLVTVNLVILLFAYGSKMLLVTGSVFQCWHLQ